MRRTGIAVMVMAAFGLLAGSAYAQRSDNARKPANQTHDQGVDDADKTPPGQARKGPDDRVVSQVPVSVLANGLAVAELDESFDEAIVVTINPDGTRTYQAVQGLATAAELVKAEPKPVSAAPVLEEK
jgi:hypothetical protein